MSIMHGARVHTHLVKLHAPLCCRIKHLVHRSARPAVLVRRVQAAEAPNHRLAKRDTGSVIAGLHSLQCRLHLTRRCYKLEGVVGEQPVVVHLMPHSMDVCTHM